MTSICEYVRDITIKSVIRRDCPRKCIRTTLYHDRLIDINNFSWTHNRIFLFILRLLEQKDNINIPRKKKSYIIRTTKLFLPLMSWQGLGVDHEVSLSVFSLPEPQPRLHPISAVLRWVVSVGVGEGNTERDHPSLLASFSISRSPRWQLLLVLMVKCRHVLSGLDLTNEIIDFWRLLWLLNTRATQIIGHILTLAFLLIHFGMCRMTR